MSVLGREAETSKFHFEGCPGASGKLASNGIFPALFGPYLWGGTQSRPTPIGKSNFWVHENRVWAGGCKS